MAKWVVSRGISDQLVLYAKAVVRAGGNVQLREDVADVAVDRLPLSDSSPAMVVRLAAGDQAQHLKLARGQSMAVSGPLAGALEARADRIDLGEIGLGAQSCEDFAAPSSSSRAPSCITERDTRARAGTRSRAAR